MESQENYTQKEKPKTDWWSRYYTSLGTLDEQQLHEDPFVVYEGELE